MQVRLSSCNSDYAGSWHGGSVPFSALHELSQNAPLPMAKVAESNSIQSLHCGNWRLWHEQAIAKPILYYRRIDKPYPIEIPLKVSLAVDTRTKKILALRLRATKAHDIRDAKYLLERSEKPSKLVADKAYDAEWLHRYCHSLSIQAVIPMRDYGTKKIYRGKSYRKLSSKRFNFRTYRRREMIESVFSAIKRKFGSSVSSVKFSAQRAEMYCRAIAHNIFLFLLDFLNATCYMDNYLYQVDY